jgi:DNA-binding GntR family transcriptional regulator
MGFIVRARFAKFIPREGNKTGSGAIAWEELKLPRQSNVFKDTYNRSLALVSPGSNLPSEPALCLQLGVSRTTVRAVLARMEDQGIITWNKRQKNVLRPPQSADYFRDDDQSPLGNAIEKAFMERIIGGDAKPGMRIDELEFARQVGVGPTIAREYLVRFSRFGLIVRRPNGSWILKGFTRQFALDLLEVREIFELRAALAFTKLPLEDPAWLRLDAIERDHHAMLALDRRSRDAFAALDDRFHQLIQQTTNNRLIRDLHDVIALIFHYHYRWSPDNADALYRRALEEHVTYIAALRKREPALVEVACRAHLKTAHDTLLQSIPSDDMP